MSKEILDDIMTDSYLESTTNVKCKVHQVLNKYYLKNKGTFVCEYDGFDDDGPDSFMHMPQILEKYHDEIIHLQNHPEYFQANEFIMSLPKHSKSAKKLNLEISKFNFDYEKYATELFPKMIQYIRANNSLIEVKDLIHEVKFTNDRKPDLKKIGMDDQKEAKLIMLAQYLVMKGDIKLQKENLTEQYMQFLEEYQLKMVEMIFNSLENLDLSYEHLLPEIARLESKNVGEIEKIRNRNFLKSHITTKKATDSLIAKYMMIIKEKDERIKQLTENLEKERNQIIYLEDSNRDLKKKINDIQTTSKDKENLHRNRIDELELLVFNLRQELEGGGKETIRLQNEQMDKLKEEHLNESNRLRNELLKQNENQKREFEEKLKSFKHQNSELEKNHKGIGLLFTNSLNESNVKRIKELEFILQDERQRRELILTESDNKIKEANNLYINTAKEFENYKKIHREFDQKFKDMNEKLNFLQKENEQLKISLREKDNWITRNIEEHKAQRLLDKKNHETDLVKLKEHENLNQKYKKDLEENEDYKKYFDMYIILKRDQDKNNSDRERLNKNNQNLQRELDLLKKENENSHKDFEVNNSELRNNYEKVVSLNNSLKLQLSDKNRKLELIQRSTDLLKEKIKPYPWGQKVNITRIVKNEDIDANRIEKIKENQGSSNDKMVNELEIRNESLKNLMENKNKKIKEMTRENDILKTKIVNNYSMNINLNGHRIQEVPKISQQEKVKKLNEKLNKKERTEKDFKNLDFLNNDLDSLLLLNRANINPIRNWVYPLLKNFVELNDNKAPINFNLLHKASIHGYGSDIFMKNCSNVKDLLVVCLTDHGKIIGGFTPLCWNIPKSEKRVYLKDDEMKSFLFSLNLNRKLPIENEDFAILCSDNMGPVFGGGSDLEVVNNCDKMLNNFGKIGHTYNDGKPIDAKEFYGGENYLVQDYEVYQVML